MAIRAETGMVNIHAQSKLIVTPHLTADIRLVTPTPMIEPVIVCVVETGTPKCSVTYNEIAPAVSAATPSNGVTFVILEPIVFTIFQPPDIVPKPMNINETNGTHHQCSTNTLNVSTPSTKYAGSLSTLM